jgi:hypothetical protein
MGVSNLIIGLTVVLYRDWVVMFSLTLGDIGYLVWTIIAAV